MCASDFSDDKVELLDPPSNSEPGDCVFVEGYERETVGGKYDVVLYIHHPVVVCHGPLTRKMLGQLLVNQWSS